MSREISRRDAMKYAGVATAGLLASPLLRWSGAEETKQHKLLFFTKSAGFQHSVITRHKPDELSFAEKLMTQWGKEKGFDVTCTKDGSVFTKEGLAPYDVVMFYTTGNLTDRGTDGTPPMPKDGLETLIDYVSSGKGFLGLHCAADTFHSSGDKVNPYIEMLGGEFVTHGSQQNAKITAVDHSWGDLKDLSDFEKVEEWYQLKNFAPDMHVLFVQETQSMQEESYRKLKPYPETWARAQGKGRVFYSSMGHREDVWESDIFQKVLFGGLRWAAGDVQADVKPNFEQATPGAVDRARKLGAA